jgi:FixJ family two-component response regulator
MRVLDRSLPLGRRVLRFAAIARSRSWKRAVMGVHEELNTAMKCLWIARRNDTLEKTKSAWQAFYEMQGDLWPFERAVSAVRGASPGTSIVLEMPDCSDVPPSASHLERCDQLVRSLAEEARNLVVICIGELLPAQLVVDWMPLGVFNYIERHSAMARYQQTFCESSCHARQVSLRYHRFTGLRERWNSLSDREAIVLEMVLEGTPNKTIATRLGVSQRTIETRRHNLYEKLDSRCLADVVKFIYELDLLAKIFKHVDQDRPQGIRFDKAVAARQLPHLTPHAISVPVGKIDSH